MALWSSLFIDMDQSIICDQLPAITLNDFKIVQAFHWNWVFKIGRWQSNWIFASSVTNEYSRDSATLGYRVFMDLDKGQ